LEGEPRVERRRFGTITAELECLRDWLKAEGVTHAVMESTGSYWKPVFNVLEGSLKVCLANPQEVKNRKGHKTDDKDGWWLAHLLRHAMIYPSFIPPREIRELRDLTRRRKRLLSDATAEKNRVQKVLHVLTDVFGVSGQLMLEALLEGKAQPAEIAQFAKRAAKKKIPEIVQALEGHRMSDHHRQMIRYSLKYLLFLEEQIAEMDRDITAQFQAAGLGPAWQLVQTVPGIQDRSAANILAETGADMQQFPSAKHLSSWAGVCPGNNRSAGKNKSSHTTRGNPWLRSALTECAWAAAASSELLSSGQILACCESIGRSESARPHRRGACPADLGLSRAGEPTAFRGPEGSAPQRTAEAAHDPPSHPPIGETRHCHSPRRLCPGCGPTLHLNGLKTGGHYRIFGRTHLGRVRKS
jgi:transposase